MKLGLNMIRRLKETILHPVALFLAQTQSDQTRSSTGQLKTLENIKSQLQLWAWM